MIQNLPLEIVAEILCNLNSADLDRNVSRVCVEWRDLVENFVWKRRAQKFFSAWWCVMLENSAAVQCDARWVCQAADNRLTTDPKTIKFTGLGHYHRPVEYHADGTTLKRIGLTYVGEFLDGFFHGFGMLTTTSPEFDFYTGHWKYDKQHGHGKYSWKNGQSFYVGEIKNGKRHGHGEYHWDGERKYVGHHKRDQLWGQGIFTHKNGSISGNWRANRQHGHCVMVGGPEKRTWKFEGEYINGERMDGVYTWLDDEE